MIASTISRVEGDEEAIRTLTWLGSSFFADIRLARFTLDTWSRVGTPDGINWAVASPFTQPCVEIWSIRDDRNVILGAMTLHFSSWSRLKRQHYFSGDSFVNIAPADRVFVRTFDRLVASATGSIAPFDLAVELGYVAVAPEARGKGLGRTLFDIFQHRAATVSGERTLAFTIVMARHAHSHCGQSLMIRLINQGSQDQRSAVSWRSLASTMRLPADLFEIEAAAYPTAWMAQQRGFSMVGYGKNLGQVWVKDLEPAAQPAHLPPVGVPSMTVTPEARDLATPMMAI